jgi:hypothetical protein
MSAKKNDFQKDLSKLADQARDGFRKIGKELSILGLAAQREKLYYDIGKKIASLNAKRRLAIPELEPYWKAMRKIDADTRRKKRELASPQRRKAV